MSLLKKISNMKHTWKTPFICSSYGYIESTYEWKLLLLMDNTSSVYRNMKSYVTPGDFFFSNIYRSFLKWILHYKNIKTGQLTRYSNLSQWQFQQTRFPKTTKISSMRNSSIAIISTSEYLNGVLQNKFKNDYIQIFPFSIFVEKANVCL